jgi:hypothetical protein
MLLLSQIRKPKPTKRWSADYNDSDSHLMGYKPIKLGSLLPSYSSFPSAFFSFLLLIVITWWGHLSAVERCGVALNTDCQEIPQGLSLHTPDCRKPRKSILNC